MANLGEYAQAYTTDDVLGYVTDRVTGQGGKPVVMTPAEHKAVVEGSADFAAKIGTGSWLLMTGELNSNGKAPEDRVRQSCLHAFGYPPDADEREHTINVLLDSGGGSLDSAFKTVQYLSRYARELNVWVPRRAKSASTLIALGAHRIYLSQFGELGPLDTQIRDPRDPATYISALDCYQSVDYVRRFGYDTMSEVLKRLVGQAGGQITLPELLDTASQFALGAITPMLQGVKALDFGGWGRSLKIGEQYARILLQGHGLEPQQASEIALRLVYGYTHHPFPIDYIEAVRIGLSAELMSGEAYTSARKVVESCHGKSFVGFISAEDAKNEEAASQEAADKALESTRKQPQGNEGEQD